ncbi:MAG: hypothetical protein U0840_18385 [Gemmataceae bacterium]
MPVTDSLLADLIRRLGLDRTNAGGRTRAILEMTLLPMIRVALRSRLGPAPLVEWVQGQASDLWSADRTRAAQLLTQRLSDRLLERIAPLPGRETVVGR